jgi:nitroreductase
VELRDAIRHRRMVRTYDPARPVPRETVEDLLDLAIRAPSAGHTQGWRFLVLDAPAAREAFWTATSDGPPDSWLRRLQTAPTLVIFFSDRLAYLDRYAEPDKGWTDRDESRWPVPFWHIDTGMAALLILLTAVDEKLGAVYFGIVPEAVAPFRAAFGVPDDHEPIGAIAIGYDAEPAPRDLRSRRRPLPDMFHHGQW